MFWPTLILVLVAIVLLFITYRQSAQVTGKGLLIAWKTTIGILPMLLLAFVIAGLVQVLIPREAVSHMIGDSSGIKGIVIGAIVGGFSPGGPYVSLPLAAGMLQAGAGIGTMVAYLTGWSLWAVGRLPMELGILGWRLTVIRFISTLTFPVLAGYFANWIARFIK